ncbi:NAD-dependent epimerase/dehydratase family protein [Saccharopolyspora taberi]|uniref:SDR family oxidoreductase n=1 Tax=Saccharopolyspora taberi TaxID=60895 RepID=A0ABN3VFH8_9PSEU
MEASRKPLRIVVAGATGNIGTSVVAALESDPGVGNVVALSRREPPAVGSKVEWIRTDVAADDLVTRVMSADAVINLAWLFQPTHDPATTWRNNVLGSIRLFEAVAAAGVPSLVHASSVAAYSPHQDRQPVKEHWPTNGWPGAAYSREKAYLERHLDAFEHQHPNIRVVRMRTAFCFKHESASQQRRLFMGPLTPNRLIRPDLLPALPLPKGIRFQAVHTDDVGEAYRLAALSEHSGAFNVAAEPLIDAEVLAALFGTRTIEIPNSLVRNALAVAWNLHLVPASPGLFDAFAQLPVMDTSRARDTLGWEPRRSSTDAVSAFLRGLRVSAGGTSPPLRPRVPGGRWHELRTGVGQRP